MEELLGDKTTNEGGGGGDDRRGEGRGGEKWGAREPERPSEGGGGGEGWSATVHSLREKKRAKNIKENSL